MPLLPRLIRGGDVGVAGQIVHAIAIDRQGPHQLLDGRNAGAACSARVITCTGSAFWPRTRFTATGDFNAFDLAVHPANAGPAMRANDTKSDFS